MNKLHLLGAVRAISFRKLILLGALLLANDSYAFLISALPASSYNEDVSIMDATLGIDSSYNVEDFEDDVFIPGFTLTYRRPNASTEHQFLVDPLQIWDGDRALYIVGGDRVSDNGGAIFTFDQALNSFGIGLANLQLAGWYIEVNGQRLVDELLTISGINASTDRNGYLFINAEQGEVINNVVIDRDELGDRVNFDHLALQVSSAPTSLITVEPDNFPVGTDISSAFPGVTLSVQGEASTKVIVVDGFSTFVGTNVATTGTKMFGQDPNTVTHIPDAEKLWDDAVLGLFRADFASPVNYVQIDLIFDDDDTGFLKAFDAGGNLLDTFTGLGDGRGASSSYCPPFCSTSVTASITRSTADIAYILAGGINGESHFLDNLQAIVPSPNAITIDIKPGDEPNSINPRSNSVITVAILTAGDFDALLVDPDSVRFGPAEAERTHKQAHVEDIDSDGDMDLVFHFKTQETGIACGDTEATLTGQTWDGVPVSGTDSVNTVGCQ